MPSHAEKRQADIDQAIAAGDAERQALNRRRWMGSEDCCQNCGGAPDGMCPIDVSHLAKVYSVHTLGALRRYLRETAAEGTKWYRRRGDTEIILYYPGCVGCGPSVPPAEYREIMITGGKR